MKNVNKSFVVLAMASAVGSPSAWSALSLENPLGDSYYSTTLAPRIDMTNIDLNYTGWKQHKASILSGSSSSSTVLSLVRPDLSSAPINGTFTMRAFVAPRGELTGGRFSFTLNDPMFGFGSTCVGSVCSAKSGTVFQGKLDSVGWSESKGFLEFGTSNFSGWACAQGWCTGAERLFFTMNNGTLGLEAGMKRFKGWSNTASGSAVIPVPAAAWLFGSGLVGLVGFGQRKKPVASVAV